MHEMSLCHSIRQIVEDQVRGQDVARVTRIRLELGRFSCVSPEALKFAFDAVMRGSVAEGADLTLLNLPGRAMCYDCAHEVTIDDRLDPCPDCGGTRLMPVSGDEMRVKDLEVI